jgi:hypothetical protein
MTWPTPSARLFERARRVRYAVATGGDASWWLEARRRRSPARSNKRRAYLYRPITTAVLITRKEGEYASGHSQILKTNPKKS